MATARFNHAAAYNIIAIRVDTGIEVTGGRIMGLAKSLAPVRKTNRSNKRNRSHPAPVGFYRRFDGKRIETTAALAMIGQSFRKPTTAGQVARLINLNDTRTVTYNPPEEGGNPDSARRVALRTAMARAGLTARIARRDRGGMDASTKADVARLHGVRIEFDGLVASATIGGTLRKSITASEVERSGKQLHLTVRAAAPYAKYVEFPTVRTRAQPFLLPAFKAFGTKKKLAAEIKKAG